MPCQALQPNQLRLHIDPATLPFADTSELLNLPVPWIGQQRAEQAARFGLSIDQPDVQDLVVIVAMVATSAAGARPCWPSWRMSWRPPGPFHPTCATCTTSNRPSARAPCACRPARAGNCAS